MHKTQHTIYRDEALRQADEAFLTESKVFRTSEVDLSNEDRQVLLTELRRQEDTFIQQAAEHEYRVWSEEEDEEESDYVLTVDELLDPFEAFKIVADLLVQNAEQEPIEEEEEEFADEADLVPTVIDGLPGDEEAMAIEEMLMEIYYGQEEPVIL